MLTGVVANPVVVGAATRALGEHDVAGVEVTLLARRLAASPVVPGFAKGLAILRALVGELTLALALGLALGVCPVVKMADVATTG